MHTLMFLCFLNYAGDCSFSDTTDQAKVDARITSIIDMENANVTVAHLALALSVRDFIEQVKDCCRSEVLIPFLEWVRL